MVIRLAVSHAAAGIFAACLGIAVSGEALAQQPNVLKECGSQYQAAKAANALNGQSWQDFLKACRARLSEQAAPAEAAPAAEAPKAESPKAAEPAPAAAPSKPAAAPEAAPAPVEAKPAVAPAKPAKEPAGAMRARQKKCGAEWKAQKADLLKKDPKLKWPKYWSACNKRLKEAGE